MTHFPIRAARSPWLLGAILTALAGCASVPLPDLGTQLPAHWRNAAHGQAAAAPDLHGWWHAFNDPRLDAVVTQSLHANLDIAEAVERLRAARALYRHRDAPFLPSLRLRTDTPIDPDASASFFVVGFDALWESGLFGRRTANEREARGQLHAAAAKLRQARVSLVAEVVRDWIDLRAAQQRLRLLTRVRDAREHSLHLLSIRAHLRLAAPIQLAQAHAAAAAADAALSEPRQAENAAAQRLAVLLGRNEPDSAWLQAGRLPSLNASTLTTAPADLLRTRPDIARAEADVLNSAGELGIAHADKYPRIGLGGSIEWSTSTLSHRDAPTNEIASFGPVINIPLFDWGLRQARAHAKSYELKASVLAYRKAVLTGMAEVETALGNLHDQRHHERASIEAWQALKKAAHAQTTRRNLGLGDGIDAADAAIARDQAGLSVIEARAARDLAYVALYKALGGAPEPKPADLAISNQRGRY